MHVHEPTSQVEDGAPFLSRTDPSGAGLKWSQYCGPPVTVYIRRLHTESITHSFEYKQRTRWRQVNYMFSVHAKLSYANTASKHLNRRLTPSPSLVLLLSIVLGTAVKIVSRDATSWTRCKGYGAFFKVSVVPVPCPRQ